MKRRHDFFFRTDGAIIGGRDDIGRRADRLFTYPKSITVAPPQTDNYQRWLAIKVYGERKSHENNDLAAYSGKSTKSASKQYKHGHLILSLATNGIREFMLNLCWVDTFAR